MTLADSNLSDEQLDEWLKNLPACSCRLCQHREFRILEIQSHRDIPTTDRGECH